MIAADAPKYKAHAESALLDMHFASLVKLLKFEPRYRWQVWLHFAGTLTASQAVALIERALKGGWAWEHDGLLHAASEREEYAG